MKHTITVVCEDCGEDRIVKSENSYLNYTKRHPCCYGCGQRRRKMAGSNNPNWKGAAVGYLGIHAWVKKELGEKPGECVHCGKGNTPGKDGRSTIQWANVSREYRRDLSDWIPLCYVCHSSYDGITRFNKLEATAIKERHANGEKRAALAKEYSVNEQTISNVILGQKKYYGAY